MSNLKVLVPMDGTEKSKDSLVWLKKYFKKESTDVTLIYVAQVIYTSELANLSTISEFDLAYSVGERVLAEASKELVGYNVKEVIIHGSIADTIIKEAIDDSFDLIVMTKSSVKGISRIFGSVATKVVRDSKVAVVVVP